MNVLIDTSRDVAALADVLSLLALLSAIVPMARATGEVLSRPVRLMLALVLALLFFNTLSNLLVWMFATDVVEAYEDYFGLLLPVLYLFAFFTFARERGVAELAQSEERFRFLVETTSDWIWQIDPGGVYTYVSPRVRDLLGYEPADVLGKTLFDLMPPAEARRVRAVLEPLMSARAPMVNIENVAVHKDGRLVTLETHGVPVLGPAGVFQGYRGIDRDITERKQMESQRLDLERQVQHAQKLESLGVLAGGIAHDFNNLLMAILGNADLALDELPPHAPARESIREIVRASRRAADLAKQMLAYSGKGQFLVEPVDLGELVREMAHLLEVSVSKKVRLTYHLVEGIPHVAGDATQIRQVVMNLITNASEAIGDESGSIVLSTGMMDCDRAYLDKVDETLRIALDAPLAEGRYVFLEVADTGCGMDAETVSRIFDPFFTTKFTGRGLGMAAVLGIVRGHRGAVRIRSQVAAGSTFTVLFPAGAAVPGQAPLSRPDAADAPAWQGRGTILLVDDEETVRTVGRRMLVRLGFDALVAADGGEALDVFRAHTDEIVCILLDLTMPHMDGEQAFSELRRIRADVAIVLCSGYNEPDATQRFAGKGLAGFIHKPFTLAELKTTLRAILPGGEG